MNRNENRIGNESPAGGRRDGYDRRRSRGRRASDHAGTSDAEMPGLMYRLGRLDAEARREAERVERLPEPISPASGEWPATDTALLTFAEAVCLPELGGDPRRRVPSETIKVKTLRAAAASGALGVVRLNRNKRTTRALVRAWIEQSTTCEQSKRPTGSTTARTAPTAKPTTSSDAAAAARASLDRLRKR